MPDSVTLTYDPYRLPTTQHRAGLAGLMVVTESLRRRGIRPLPVISAAGDGSYTVQWTQASLATVFEDLFKAAPRVPAELPVRLMEVSEGSARSVACRTVNVSSSGMLLRVSEAYRPGAVVVFEMALPGSTLPVRGHARVVRRTSVRREPFPGVGVAFAGLHDNARARLDSFLQAAAV